MNVPYSLSVTLRLLITVVLAVPLVSLGLGPAAPSTDSDYRGFNSAVQIFQPRYWLVTEENFESINGSQIDIILLRDQADQGSRVTKGVNVIRSNAAGIFDVPVSVVARVTPAQLVNYYIDRFLRSTPGAKVLNVNVKDQSGDRVYLIEWSYVSTGKIKFVAFDNFIFRDETVYQIHGEYADYISGLREKVSTITQSFKILK